MNPRNRVVFKVIEYYGYSCTLVCVCCIFSLQIIKMVNIEFCPFSEVKVRSMYLNEATAKQSSE